VIDYLTVRSNGSDDILGQSSGESLRPSGGAAL